MPKNSTPLVHIDRTCYAMATQNGNKAEITMYGEIVESRPIDWWTGEVLEGQFIVCDEFLDDLKQIENCEEITLRMNSCGGNAGVSILIHNRLRELAAQGKILTCIVDGVAMSGGSLIMCACDNVQVNSSSLIMIHKSWGSLWGGYNADELRELADKQDAFDKAQASIYQRKTNLSEEEILRMMAATTYMTGREAQEKGFADEILNEAAVEIAASVDGRCLYVKDRKVHLAPGIMLPDNIPKVDTGAVPEYTKLKSKNDKGGKHMAQTIEELRTENPELVSQLESETRVEATQAEQHRLQEIDEVATLLDPTLVQEAKYGEKACTAQELTFRAAQAAAKQRTAFLAGMNADAAPSAKIPGVQAPEDKKDAQKTPEQLMAEARSNVAKMFHKED